MGNCISSKEPMATPDPVVLTVVKNTTVRSDVDEDMSAAKTKVSRYLKQSHDMIFANNRIWIESRLKDDPTFFDKLSSPQHPDYL